MESIKPSRLKEIPMSRLKMMTMHTGHQKWREIKRILRHRLPNAREKQTPVSRTSNGILEASLKEVNSSRGKMNLFITPLEEKLKKPPMKKIKPTEEKWEEPPVKEIQLMERKWGRNS
jgi:hypothetical protein